MSKNQDNQPPDLTVTMPVGDPPCVPPTGSVEEVCDPASCCNYFKLDMEGRGSSFIMSAGGPFLIPFPTDCGIGFQCPPPESPINLSDTGVVPPYASPGPLSGIVCMDLTPGSYRVEARVSVKNASPGFRVVMVYYPNCEDPSLFYTIADCSAPCPDWTCPQQGGQKIFNVRDPACFDCCCSLVVPNIGCRPGFEIKALNGCPQINLSPDPATIQASLENFQLTAIRLTGRDVVNCGGNPLMSGDIYFGPCATLDCPAG